MPRNSRNQKQSSPNFSSFILEFGDRLQQVSDTYLDSYDEEKAFVYLVGELFETTNPDKFEFTDGPKDGGIDFAIKDVNSYIICQCKYSAVDTVPGMQANIPTFDQSALEEISAAIDMLKDDKGDYDVKSSIKRLRGDYQKDRLADPEATKLTAILAISGELTPQALIAFHSKKRMLAEEDIRLKLIGWKEIYHAIHAIESPADIDFDITLTFDDEKNLLSHHDYCYVLANAFDFYTAFREHEWNLFEWNVRLQLLRSSINRRIVATLQGSKGRKKFHHYNNGILITCRNYHPDRRNNRIKLSGPQIINGCQTVRSICEAYESLNPSEQEHFRENTKVQVKIITTTEPEFIGELVISTNDQNPMNQRNLKSNTVEQRDIQKSFRDLPAKWFYQRKDGELESLIIASSRVRWFRKSDYAIGTTRKYRFIDNQEMAKAWHAFIGYSDQALRGGTDYFEDQKGIYNTIFRRSPSQAFWSSFSAALFSPDDQYFQPGSPNVYQYLLAYGVGKLVDANKISYKTNRNEAIRRGIDSGRLQTSPDSGACISNSEAIANYLSTDTEYFFNIMINNMRELIIEFCAFILCLKYAGCDAIASQKILCGMPKERTYFDNGFDANFRPDQTQDGNSILGPIYEFVKDCIRQYSFQYSAEIKAAPRLKSYFWQRSTVNKFRELIFNRDQAIVGYDKSWKKIEKTFLGSLPNI